VFIAASCKKKPDYAYAVYLNGISEKGYNYTASYHYDSISGLQQFNSKLLLNTSANNNYVQVNFSSLHYIVPGTYYTAIGNARQTTCSFGYNIDTIFYASVSGILQVTQIDTVNHKVTAHFQFVAVSDLNSADTITATEGIFDNITYKVQ
jgi:hypothetical protein